MLARGRPFCTAATAIALAVATVGCESPFHSHNLSVSPNSARVGQKVTFTAHFTYKALIRDVWGAWALDGDGTFESGQRSPRSPQSTSRTYDAPRTVTVAHLLRVVYEDDFGFPHEGESVVTKTLVIEAAHAQNQPPLASFTATPDPALVGRQSELDATSSMDPDGQVARYQWDIDGNGTYEHDTGANPHATATFKDPGSHRVGLKVTDNSGENGETTRTLVVEGPAVDLPSAKWFHSHLSSARSFELKPSERLVAPGGNLLDGNRVVVAGMTVLGKISARPFPARLRRGGRDVRVAVRLDVSTNLSSGDSTATGAVLLGFPAGGRACLGVRVRMTTRQASERYRVAGGSGGAASRLRGLGTAHAQVGVRRFTLDGRDNFHPGRTRSFKLARSGCAPLLSLVPPARHR